MLALAMISLEMEKLIPDWLPLTIELLQKAQVGVNKLNVHFKFISHWDSRVAR